ncbi:MAG TPA: DMT family transporter [Candidatus Lokiarchaeia archaeon]|nr:DMT family transporter [Candidatus Lokiarchaeia archaeon]
MQLERHASLSTAPGCVLSIIEKTFWLTSIQARDSKKRLLCLSTRKPVSARAIVFLILAAFFWAFPPALGTIVESLSPFFITTFRLFLALIIFLPFLFTKTNRKLLKDLHKKTIIWLIIGGGAFFGPHYVFYFLSLHFTPPIHVSILLQAGYVFSAIFCIKFLKERWDRYTIFGFMLSIAGVLVIVFDYSSQVSGYTYDGILVGDALILISMLLWAIYSVINKKYLESVGSVPAIAFNFFFGGLAILPFSYGDFATLPYLEPGIILALCLIALFGSALGYLFYNLGLKGMDGTKANIVLLTNPVFGVVISVILVAGEPITIPFLIGAALVILSMYFVNKEKKSVQEIAGNTIKTPADTVENTS